MRGSSSELRSDEDDDGQEDKGIEEASTAISDRGKVVVEMRGGSDNRLADLARYAVLKSDVVKTKQELGASEGG